MEKSKRRRKTTKKWQKNKTNWSGTQERNVRQGTPEIGKGSKDITSDKEKKSSNEENVRK